MTRRSVWEAFSTMLLAAAIVSACRAEQAPTASPTPQPASERAATPPASPTARPTSTHTPTPAPTATPTPTEQPAANSRDLPALRVDRPAITSTLEGGWVLYELPDEEFSIALPPGWAPIDTSLDSLTTMIEMMGKQNPQLGGLLGSQALADMVAEGIVFSALDPSADAIVHGKPPTINVLKIATGIALPIDMVVALTLAQLESIALPDVPISSERVELDGIEAEVIRYVGKCSALAGDPLQVSFTHMVVPFGEKLYIISLSAPLELGSEYQDTLDQIAAGFRLLE